MAVARVFFMSDAPVFGGLFEVSGKRATSRHPEPKKPASDFKSRRITFPNIISGLFLTH
jgi:hypothetical protein